MLCRGAQTEILHVLTVFPAYVRKESSASRLAETESLMTSSLIGLRLAGQQFRIDESLARQLTTVMRENNYILCSCLDEFVAVKCL